VAHSIQTREDMAGTTLDLHERVDAEHQDDATRRR
jgi:hypothetical protein